MSASTATRIQVARGTGPEPGDYAAAACALGPALRARAAACEAARTVPAETIADFHRAGFFRMLQPRAFGGAETGLMDFYEVVTEVARHCGASGWVLSILGIHAWQLGLFPRSVAEAVWGADPQMLASSSYNPTGTARAVPGGYELSGRWSFSSGCDHAGWALLGALAPARDMPACPWTFLVPMADLRIEDTWHVAGLCGTGSKDVVIDKAFVPSDRALSFLDSFLLDNPGKAWNAGPLYRLPFGLVFSGTITAPAIGIAQGAIEDFRAQAYARRTHDGACPGEDPEVQHALATSIADVAAARALFRADIAELTAAADADVPPSVARRAQIRFQEARAIALCMGAIDRLYAIAGGRAIYQSNPLQRAFRDIHAIRVHPCAVLERPGRNAMRVAAGEPSTDLLL